jgi:hypothetical protein
MSSCIKYYTGTSLSKNRSKFQRSANTQNLTLFSSFPRSKRGNGWLLSPFDPIWHLPNLERNQSASSSVLKLSLMPVSDCKLIWQTDRQNRKQTLINSEGTAFSTRSTPRGTRYCILPIQRFLWNRSSTDRTSGLWFTCEQKQFSCFAPFAIASLTFYHGCKAFRISAPDSPLCQLA